MSLRFIQTWRIHGAFLLPPTRPSQTRRPSNHLVKNPVLLHSYWSNLSSTSTVCAFPCHLACICMCACAASSSTSTHANKHARMHTSTRVTSQQIHRARSLLSLHPYMSSRFLGTKTGPVPGRSRQRGCSQYPTTASATNACLSAPAQSVLRNARARPPACGTA